MSKDCKAKLLNDINTESTFIPIAKKAFEAADKDNNGIIDIKELGMCMNEVAKGLNMDQPQKKAIEKEFKRLDTNKSGTIDFDEFKLFVKDTMKKIIEKM